MRTSTIIISSGIIILLGFWVGIQISDRIQSQSDVAVKTDEIKTDTMKLQGKEIVYQPPSMEEVPEGPMGEAIKYGYKIVNETNTVLDGYVGNELSCTSCHAGAGLDKDVSSLVGVSQKYPRYMPREGEIRTMEDRINGCMLRSMNGKEIPNDSEEMKAILSYFHYISRGTPTGEDLPWLELNNKDHIPTPNVEDGEDLYNQSCISCHAADGSGTGANTGPALWGGNSFNDGAGMARMSKMTAYIQRNMPVGQENTLSDQEAANLAAYILSQDRPVWKEKMKDWPNGDRPNDIIDRDKREKIKNGTIEWDKVLNIK